MIWIVTAVEFNGLQKSEPTRPATSRDPVLHLTSEGGFQNPNPHVSCDLSRGPAPRGGARSCQRHGVCGGRNRSCGQTPAR
jgi:hypothetical protein